MEIDGEAWPVQGSQLVLVDRGRVLVQFRPWPPGWELPGGHCEPGEAPAEAALRETEEETGFTARIVGLVGIYTWGGLRSAGDAVYLGEITGGRRRRSIESLAVRFVARDEMPGTLFPWCRERILDALARAGGAAPIHRVQPVTMYHVMTFGTRWLREPVDAMHAWWRRRRPTDT